MRIIPQFKKFNPTLARHAHSLLHNVTTFGTTREVITRPPAVLWVTNLAAPYRRPVWRSLAERYDLTIGLLESNAGLKRDQNANRGQDWLYRAKDGIRYKELPTWKFSRGESRFYILKSLGALWTYDAVLFGGWESPAYWTLLVACTFLGIAKVGFYESHGGTITHKTGFPAWVRSRFFRSMNMVIVPGEAAAIATLNLGVPPHRLIQGFNAVDVHKFHAASAASTWEGCDVSSRHHRYLYVGQLIARKRVDAIISAFAQIAEQDDELTIVGTGELGEKLRIMAGKSGRRIQFRDHVANEDMPAVMARHHTLILVSDNEVWGLVANEALASGMHVVVSENCGVVPSIRSMRGVYRTDPGLASLAQQMQVSRNEWSGRIVEPEILQFTPEGFADAFSEAFTLSLKAARRKKAFIREEGMRL